MLDMAPDRDGVQQKIYQQEEGGSHIVPIVWSMECGVWSSVESTMMGVENDLGGVGNNRCREVSRCVEVV